VAAGSANNYFRRELANETLAVAREAEVNHFDEEPVSLIGTATLRWVEEQLPGVPTDVRRFRPNLVVRTAEPFAEEAWVGRRVWIGSQEDAVELEFTHVLQRCVMVVAEQADLPEASDMLKLLARRADQPLRLAVVGMVARGGTVRRGDVVHVE